MTEYPPKRCPRCGDDSMFFKDGICLACWDAESWEQGDRKIEKDFSDEGDE